MSHADRYDIWWTSLTEAQRQEAVGVSGPLPEWMAQSLVAAEVTTVPAQVDGVDGQLMPTSLADYLSAKAAEPRNSL
jgi:hypothetical protein